MDTGNLQDTSTQVHPDLPCMLRLISAPAVYVLKGAKLSHQQQVLEARLEATAGQGTCLQYTQPYIEAMRLQ